MIQHSDFPRLTPKNHRITSPSSAVYNCIAWSAGDVLNWWQPGVYWPVPADADDFGIGALEAMFKTLGYESCENGLLEKGKEKVAIYGDSLIYTHAARQLQSGAWTSKLGAGEDIEHHSPYDVADGVYGAVVGFMRRPVAVAPP